MKKLLAVLLLICSPVFAGSPGQAPGSNGDVLINKNTQYGALHPGNCISTNNTIDVANGPVRAGISTTDSISASDKCKYVTYTAASNISIPAGGTTGFTQGFALVIKNAGTVGNDVLTPSSPTTCNGASSCTVPPGTQAYVYLDNTNNYSIDFPNNLPVAISTLPSSLITKIAGFSADGAGQVIPTGFKGCSPPYTYNATITGFSMILDISGSAVVGIWKTNNAKPSAGNSIVASAPPTISSAVILSPVISTTLTGWTTSIVPNDVICWNVNSASTATHLDFALYGTVTQ